MLSKIVIQLIFFLLRQSIQSYLEEKMKLIFKIFFFPLVRMITIKRELGKKIVAFLLFVLNNIQKWLKR